MLVLHMSAVPFRAKPKSLRWPSAAVVIVALLLGAAHFWISASSPMAIFAVDGDTVRHQGQVYRLVGFDVPDSGSRGRCEDQRQRAEKATSRGGEAQLQRVACACKSGEEGTSRCNYGRLCASLTIDGRDVG